MDYVSVYLAERKKTLSKNSLAQYTSVLNSFKKELGKPVELANKNDIENYIGYLKNSKKVTSGSLIVVMSIIRKFYAYMKQNGHIESNPMASITINSGKTPDEISEAEAELESASTNPRKYIELSLIYNHKIKLNELLSIRKDDIDFTSHTVRVLDGEEERIIRISRDLSVILQCYTEYMAETDLVFALAAPSRQRDNRLTGTGTRKPSASKVVGPTLHKQPYVFKRETPIR